MATSPIRLSIADLPAHLATLESELREGHTVELVRGDEVIGEVHARSVGDHVTTDETDTPGEPQRPPMPDFMARLKAMWGDRVFEDSTEWIRKDRDAGF